MQSSIAIDYGLKEAEKYVIKVDEMCKDRVVSTIYLR